jgi:hypothetical protein
MKFGKIAVAVGIAFCALTANANLITNGDFSAGTTGWTTTNGTNYTDPTGFREGASGANDALSQSFSDFVGGLLTLDFDFGSSSGYQYVDFNGVTVVGSLVSGASSYQHYTFTLGTASGLDTLTFNGRNDPSYNTLAHVVVAETAQIPEPESLALVGLGLAVLAVARRRKSA